MFNSADMAEMNVPSFSDSGVSTPAPAPVVTSRAAPPAPAAPAARRG